MSHERRKVQSTSEKGLLTPQQCMPGALSVPLGHSHKLGDAKRQDKTGNATSKKGKDQVKQGQAEGACQLLG